MASVFDFYYKAQESLGISLPVIGLIAWIAYLICLGTYRRMYLLPREKIDTLVENCHQFILVLWPNFQARSLQVGLIL